MTKTDVYLYNIRIVLDSFHFYKAFIVKFCKLCIFLILKVAKNSRKIKKCLC